MHEHPLILPISAVAIIALIVCILLSLRRRHRPRPSAAAPFLAPRALDITAVFTNLDGSVSLFERLGDRAGASLLNEYYAAMTPVARRHGGYLDRLAFDSLLILFGDLFRDAGADHATAAVQTVLDMQAEMVRLNDRLAARGLPRLNMRAGVATGRAMVGDVGGPQFRQFTAIGPPVALAKSLEQACKRAGAPNLVSPLTCARAGGRFRFRPIAGAPQPDRGGAASAPMEVTGRSR